MRTRGWFYAVVIGAAAALAACSGAHSLMPGTSQAVPSEAQQYAQLRQQIPDALPGEESGFIPFRSANPVRARCPQTSDPHRARCMSFVRTDIPAEAVAPDTFPRKHGFSPAQLQAAYGLTNASLRRGKGVLVATVDGMGYPNVVSDLATYRKAAGLPPCTPKNGCFKIVNRDGNTSPTPAPDEGWAGEESLDLDMISAICPNCHILLVQAGSYQQSDLYLGVQTAVNLHALVVSNSYVSPEDQPNNNAFSTPGHVFVASAGDFGAYSQGWDPPAGQPCSLPTVVCAGGTQLLRASNARGWSEQVWDDFSDPKCGPGGCGATASGCSTVVPKPSFQSQNVCAMRAETDLSADAAVSTPVATYFTFTDPVSGTQTDKGWEAVGGTSGSGPMLAGVFALAGNAATVPQPRGIWKTKKTNFYDVVKGVNFDTNDPCPSNYTTYICKARKGYDGPTGWGTPKGIAGF